TCLLLFTACPKLSVPPSSVPRSTILPSSIQRTARPSGIPCRGSIARFSEPLAMKRRLALIELEALLFVRLGRRAPKSVTTPSFHFCACWTRHVGQLGASGSGVDVS